MQIALEQAKLAEQLGEVPVGAIIVYQNNIIAKSHNLMRSFKSSIAHAETLSIQQAIDYLKTPYLDQCDLYVTLEPCAMCAGAISLSRIKKVFFGAYDPKGGVVEHGPKIWQTSLHKPEFYGGIMERECQKLLQIFFQKCRY